MAEIRNTLSWSISRDRVFRECPRAYYYRYYGSWGGWDAAAPERARELYLLKQLDNRWSWVGRIVHELVALALNRHRYGRPTELDELKEMAVARLRKGFVESRDGVWRDDPKNRTGLFEHEYGVEVSDAEWARMRDRAHRCLENFQKSEIRRIIMETPIEDWLPIDAMDSFEFDGVTVYVAPDFALKNPHGNAMLIDWKTGWPGKEEDRAQIVCYGLFAQSKWGIEPRRAIGELHYLLNGNHDVITLDEAALAEGTESIRGSLAAMRGLLDDVEGNVAVEEAFAQTEDRDRCARCSFRRVCWPAWPETGELGEPGVPGESAGELGESAGES